MTPPDLLRWALYGAGALLIVAIGVSLSVMIAAFGVAFVAFVTGDVGEEDGDD